MSIHTHPTTLAEISELEDRVNRCRQECRDMPVVCANCDELLDELAVLRASIPEPREP